MVGGCKKKEIKREKKSVSASAVVNRILDRTMGRIAKSPKASKRYWAIAKGREMAEVAAGSYIWTVGNSQILSQDAAVSIYGVLDVTLAHTTAKGPPKENFESSDSGLV